MGVLAARLPSAADDRNGKYFFFNGVKMRRSKASNAMFARCGSRRRVGGSLQRMKDHT